MALATVTHSVTHLDQPPDQQQQQQLLQQQQLTRKTSLIRSLKHRRTSSNGSTSTPSSLNKFNFFKKDGVDSKTHSRKVSESSIHSLNGTAFSTPPLVNRNSFNGSFARADVIDEDKVPGFEFVNEPSNLGIAGIKAEISSLMSTKSELETGLITLKVERSQLEESLRKLSKQVTFEESKLNELHKQVAELQGTKARLTEENNQLREQNRHYKLTRSSSIETDSSSPLNKPTDLAESVTTLGESTTSNEDEQSHKATRLRFWRRQKNLVTTNAPVATIPESAQSSTSSVPSSFSAQGLRISQPVSNSVSGSKFHRSISTNILDSFLGDHQQSHDLFSSTIQARADYEGTKVPFIITKCISVVELRGLESEGIYRISGGNSTIVAIETAFANLAPGVTEDKKLEELMSGDINAVTSALKRYLRKLNDPIIPFGLYDEFIRVSTSNPRERRAQELKKVIYKLPRANRHTLWLLCNHLKLVSSMQNVNRMGFKNLAVVFAPTLARDSTGEREMTDMGARNDSTECLLTECEEVFAGYSG
ncbi:uncharacterized protein SPAPADRAFT_62606 [Spathaspora passalidarum NRRL Y-27907]|uniref:Rho-GAP domain-containing protein n=1 Tax=Spathaspora passalidarum (strain NRRL Y-27907 / 11-Y1) TaxID=619300 RepID=G3ASX1_SPAPN|nr:uncharacterized protein SPAPADRAFT_62606 [Spathaspora passalidarum NRRL Y-27907]EGW30753.1 hypothetical protein SPAPADRAFT_62606 [Spathaspora passalidarum NRRL Y-27907]